MIVVPGPVIIFAGAAQCSIPFSNSVGSVNLSAMMRFGQTENGVQVSISNRAHRVNVDDMGGTQGAPAELIYLGSSAAIRGVLVDYGSPNSNSGVAEALMGMARGLRKISGDVHSTLEGEIAAPGTPLFEYGYGYCLLLVGKGMSYFFPRCELATSPREWNVSSLERKTSFTMNAYEVPVVSGTTHKGRCLYLANPTVSNGRQVDYTSCRTTAYGLAGSLSGGGNDPLPLTGDGTPMINDGNVTPISDDYPVYTAGDNGGDDSGGDSGGDGTEGGAT